MRASYAILVALLMCAGRAGAESIVSPASFGFIDSERPNPAVLSGSVTPFEKSLGKLDSALLRFQGDLIGRLDLPVSDPAEHGYATFIDVRLESEGKTLFESRTLISFDTVIPRDGVSHLDAGNTFGISMVIEGAGLKFFKKAHDFSLTVEAVFSAKGEFYSAATIGGSSSGSAGITQVSYTYTPRRNRVSGLVPEPRSGLLLAIGGTVVGVSVRRRFASHASADRQPAV